MVAPQDADVVFIGCTAFGDEMMRAISKKCEQLKPGARIITLTRALVQSDADAFMEINRQHCHCSFGPATAFVFQRTDPLALEKNRELRALASDGGFFNLNDAFAPPS